MDRMACGQGALGVGTARSDGRAERARGGADAGHHTLRWAQGTPAELPSVGSSTAPAGVRAYRRAGRVATRGGASRVSRQRLVHGRARRVGRVGRSLGLPVVPMTIGRGVTATLAILALPVVWVPASSAQRNAPLLFVSNEGSHDIT